MFETDPRVQAASPTLANVTRWITERQLLPEAYAEGLLIGQAKAHVRPGYLAGQYSTRSRWYYFPVALLIKMPLTVVVLFFAGVVAAAARWRQLPSEGLFALLPIGVFLGVAMAAHINIGLRHILPIYPFVLLLAAGAVAALWSSRFR